ncbi:hypothetical protein ONZ45_g5467 [Pleurotus djamor]|nr:hypothetical protein ONZ45_g5467 [Pleurotus djamor]
MSDYPPFVSRLFGDEYENVFGRGDDKDDDDKNNGRNGGGRGRGGNRNGNNNNPNCGGRGSGDGKGNGKNKRGDSKCRGLETDMTVNKQPDTSPAAGAGPGSPIPQTTSPAIPISDKTSSSAVGKSSHQLVIVLAVLSAIIGLLVIGLSFWLLRRKISKLRGRRSVNWNPFYAWKYGRRDPPSIRNSRDVEDVDDYPYSLRYDHLPSPSTRSSWDDEKKFRAISVGGNTSHTLTTSNTNLVVAAPPMPPLAHLRRPSPELELRSGFYDPPTHPVAATELPPDHLLVAGGVRNAELLLSRNNSANSTLPGS